MSRRCSRRTHHGAYCLAVIVGALLVSAGSCVSASARPIIDPLVSDHVGFIHGTDAGAGGPTWLMQGSAIEQMNEAGAQLPNATKTPRRERAHAGRHQRLRHHKHRHHRRRPRRREHNPPAPNQSAQPQLVVCSEGNFYAIQTDSSDTIVTPLAYGPTGNFSLKNALGGCGLNADISPAPHFTGWAATSQMPDGSRVAGYVAEGTDDFTGLSGHAESYSGATVMDARPMFSPNGELWWEEESDQAPPNGNTNEQGVGFVWHATPPDGGAQKYAQGSLGGFLPNGEPSPFPAYASPSGHVLVFAQNGHVTYVADASQVNGRCAEAASEDFFTDAFTLSASCPGVANTGVHADPTPASSCLFTGMINDEEYACLQVGEEVPGGPTYYETVRFALAGGAVTLGEPTPLTPSTQLTAINLGVAPDGKTLWYELRHPNGTTSLYEVPTSGYVSNPRSFSPHVVSGAASAEMTPEGWLWDGKYTPLTEGLSYE